MKVRVFNIDYDTDKKFVDLPKEIFMFIPSTFEEEEIEEFISDEISNFTDYLHFGFQYEKVCKF